MSFDQRMCRRWGITGIIALAHSLRQTVIAEGVETLSQRNFLVDAGCDFLQGYLLSKPIPAEEFKARFMKAKQLDLTKQGAT